MTPLDEAIKNALANGGENNAVNKAYLEFIKANFVVPIHTQSQSQAAPEVLFLQEGEHIFLPVFTEMTYFTTWANEISNEINILRLSGVDLLRGIGNNVTVCLNIGAPYYKEFNPSEAARMRSIVLKLFKN